MDSYVKEEETGRWEDAEKGEEETHASLRLLFVNNYIVCVTPTISFTDAGSDMSFPGWLWTLWGSGGWFGLEQVFLIMASIVLGRKDTEILPMQNLLSSAAWNTIYSFTCSILRNYPHSRCTYR